MLCQNLSPGDRKVDMKKMIFVTGFARGGTSWLRSCIASHPDIAKIPHEMVVFRDYSDRATIEKAIDEAVRETGLGAPFYVNKAPANAPFIGKGCRLFPEAKFIFIIRDPRDVFISHKRGKQKWMGGKNSTVSGCMQKIEKYYKGYLDAKECDNVLLVTYEELHQDFHATLRKVFRFIGARDDEDIIRDSFAKNNFLAVAGKHQENRDSATRKGVVGDWVNFLSRDEERWYRKNAFWSDLMQRHGYRWEPPTYRSIITAMKEAGVRDLTEDDLLALNLSPASPNLLLFHDIDDLKTKEARNSVLKTAQIEGELGIAAIYNFLPLDDKRYRFVREKTVIEIIHKIKSLSPRAAIGLHLNAAERFFPAKMDDVGDGHPDMAKAATYLHEQIDAYAKQGIQFRTATAHGYGRAKRKPNNRDSLIFMEELEKRRIKLFDTTLRQLIDDRSSLSVKFTDVGEPLRIMDMPNNGAIDNPDTYRQFPPGSLIRFLTHPGNYNIERPLSLGLRVNLPPRT